MKLTPFIKHFRIDTPHNYTLSKRDPAITGGLKVGKSAAENLFAEGIERLSDLQERLYALDRWAILIIFQAMDAGGKDSAIKHVMSGINPQGCDVHSFKESSEEELNHDFSWREACRLPERGRIGIFNRSYYEEVFVSRVEPDVLKRQKLPSELFKERIWQDRFEDIVSFERHLARNGMIVLKFFLHLSKDEQRRRFLERIETPAENWKFSMQDIAKRKPWQKYIAAYEDMIRNTTTRENPWHVVPADHKWLTRIAVA